MLTRSKRMEPVQRLADDRAEQAGRQYAEQGRRVAEQQERLTQLEAFRREYQERLRGSAGAGIDAFRLRDYNAFIARIDAAIGQQRESVARSQRDAEHLRGQWMEVLGRANALGKVVERARNDEAKDAERRAQRQSDDFSQRRPALFQD